MVLCNCEDVDSCRTERYVSDVRIVEAKVKGLIMEHIEAHQAHIRLGFCLAVHKDGQWCYRRGNVAHVEHSAVNRKHVLKWADVDGQRCPCRDRVPSQPVQ